MIGQVGGWRLSWHAEQRAIERGFSRTEILNAVTRPGVQYMQSGQYIGREVRSNGRIAAVLDSRTRTIVTLLYRDPTSPTRLTSAGRR